MDKQPPCWCKLLRLAPQLQVCKGRNSLAEFTHRTEKLGHHLEKHTLTIKLDYNDTRELTFEGYWVWNELIEFITKIGQYQQGLKELEKEMIEEKKKEKND